MSLPYSLCISASLRLVKSFQFLIMVKLQVCPSLYSFRLHNHGVTLSHMLFTTFLEKIVGLCVCLQSQLPELSIQVTFHIAGLSHKLDFVIRRMRIAAAILCLDCFSHRLSFHLRNNCLRRCFLTLVQ